MKFIFLSLVPAMIFFLKVSNRKIFQIVTYKLIFQIKAYPVLTGQFYQCQINGRGLGSFKIWTLYHNTCKNEVITLLLFGRKVTLNFENPEMVILSLCLEVIPV